MNNNPLLEVKDLSIAFNIKDSNIVAVKSLNFSIAKAEIVGLVGESGSGKSVAALSILGLLDKQNANITADFMLFHAKNQVKIDIAHAKESDLVHLRGREIGMIFQEPMSSLNPVMKCGKQVAEGLLLHKLETKSTVKNKVLQLFQDVGLDNVERIYNSYPHQISGGQKQRVMIAMAISCSPSLLIADEPTTALDVTVQKTIIELLKKLCKERNMSMLFISHDLNLVKDLADKIMVMYRSEIVEQGTAQDIFNHPQNPYTKALIQCRPPIDRKLKVLPTINDFMGIEAKNRVFIPEIVDNAAQEKHNSDLSKNTALLVLNNLTTSYELPGRYFWNAKIKFKAIQDIGFQLFKAEVLGIVGESGSGKSTLGRSICRLVDSELGQIMYLGVDVAKLPEHDFSNYRKDIQIIFQDPYASLNPTMKIGEAILEPMTVHKIYTDRASRIQKVYELLENVGLNKTDYDKYPHEFSGGQRQRISIARALSLSPKILVCDESVSALDVNVQAQVLNLLKSLQEKYQLTMLFITHDLSVVRFICDRVIVLKSGKMVEIGSVEQIFEHPESDYTKQLLEAIPGSI